MKNKLRYYLMILLIVLSIQSITAQELKPVHIGILHDGLIESAPELIENLSNELKALLGSRYNVQIKAEYILDCKWKAAAAKDNYDQLIKNDKIDIILGFGVITSSILVKETEYLKPVITIGIIDPKLQKLKTPVNNSSGIHNFSYLLFNQFAIRDLNAFYQVYPYKKIGFVLYNELHETSPKDISVLQQVMEKYGSELSPLPITNGIEDILNLISDEDAIYLSHLGKFEHSLKRDLINELNDRKLPTFGRTIADVKTGALAAVAVEEDMPKVFRRFALDVEAILNGEDAANLPINITFKEKLTLNMETARKIDFSPKFSTLSKATLLNEFELGAESVFSLSDVINQAIHVNLDLLIEDENRKSSKKDISLARANFFPAFSLNASGTQIDKKRAESSFGSQAERTISGSATVEQLIFSEQALGNLNIQNHLYKAAEFEYEQQKLNIVLNAAIAYFNILKAKTYYKIQKDNVILTEKNLDVAKLREAVGHSGLADVYRWESNLTSANTNLLAARNNIKLAKFQLNQLLNKPMSDEFIIRETSISDSMNVSYLSGTRNLINSPKSMEIYTDFLVKEALTNSPEVKMLDENIAALDRSLTSWQLKRFVPTLGLGAKADHIFSRSGAGSDVPGYSPIDDSWSVGITAALPLFQGGESQLKAQQVKIQINTLKLQRSQLMQNIELNVRASILDAVVSMVNLESSKKSAELARKSLYLVSDAYSNGTVSIVNLIDAQNASLNSESNALNSTYEFLISALKVERAVGKFTVLSSSEEKSNIIKRAYQYFENK